MKEVKERQGAAAIYTVVFFCILVGIITISFISVMIQDVLSSSTYDLSQSAYDSAQAGIEDAKVVLLKYNSCVTGGTCDERVKNAIEADSSSEDCDIIGKSLQQTRDGDDSFQSGEETRIRTSTAGDTDDSLDMAYTCVQVAIDTDDYLGSLTTTSDLKVIPLRGESDEATRKVNKVIVRWFSTSNYRSIQGRVNNTDDLLYIPNTGGINLRSFAAKSTAPPVIKVGLIQTDQTFSLSDFDKSNGNNTDRATMFLRPVVGGGNNSISAVGVANTARAGSTDYSTSVGTNYPFDVNCNKLTGGSEDLTDPHGYACWAEINLPSPYRGGPINPNTRFLIVSAPYSELETDFSVEMRDDAGKTVQFHNVQPRVDSTGRANDVFRRIEARIEMVDTNFPYPRYALSTYGDGAGEGSIFKNYWATNNCWYMSNGTSYTCSNYEAIGG